MNEHVRVENQGAVLAITLARPERRNAITVAMYAALADAFEGAAKDITALDAIIVKYADNWRFERLSTIDRAILRLAIHEMNGTDTPPKVILNEAVELAKKFSSEESGSFVNGILDAVHKSLKLN